MPTEEQTYRKSIDDKLTALQETGNATLAQATKTNGRVTTLESRLNETDLSSKIFRARVTTAIALLTFLVGSVLVPILGFYMAGGAIHMSRQSTATSPVTMTTTYGDFA